ncbi:MAG: glycosyltransferase [Bacteroidetes bacterium]|nr:glycosyltransferase [Bacteroidota bacterium]
MTIAFLISNTSLSGGLNVIFEHATRISFRGNATVYMIMDHEVNNADLFWYPEAKRLTWISYNKAQDMLFDAVISTWWYTCFLAYQIKAKSYFYFNQSVESKFYPKEDLIHITHSNSAYLLGFQIITEATWIKKHISKNYGINSDLVLNGIRKDIYYESGSVISKREEGHLRVLVEGPLNIPYKNTEKAIELCLKSNADEVWLMTSSKIDSYNGVHKVFSEVPIRDTANIYRSCDLLVKLSYVEGMFGPPLEMFHCGGTVIVYNVTGHDEYIINNYNGYVIKMDNEAEVIQRINKLKEQTKELKRLKNNALRTASTWKDWESASLIFENIILAERKDALSFEQLKYKTELFNDWYKLSTTQNIYNLHLQELEIMQSRFNSIKNSKAYKLGKLLLHPIAFLKRSFLNKT